MMYICLFTFKAQCDIVEIESIKTISVSSTQLIKSLVRNASHDEAKNYIHKRYITKLLKGSREVLTLLRQPKHCVLPCKILCKGRK